MSAHPGLAGLAERQRAFLVRVAAHWCRRSPLEPEDLVQDAFARMAEQRVLPSPDERAERAWALHWLGRAWDTHWQAQRAEKRADADKHTASLDKLTAPRLDGDEIVPGLQVAARDDVEAAVVALELGRLVGLAVASVPPPRPDPRRGADPRFARSRRLRKVREAVRAAMADAGWAA